MSEPVFQVRGLTKRYGDVVAVAGVDFDVPEGICLGLLGPNGAGKTTTVEMLEGIQQPSTGEILYRGTPLDRRARTRFGIQFQSTVLQDYLSVGECLDLFRGLYPAPLPRERLIELCELGEILDRDNRKLSGGQKQRLLLALALLNDPQVLFLDEPTTGLDPQARRNFWRLIEDIKRERKTLVLTTHYMEEAYRLCDRILIVDHGRIIAEGTPDELLAAHFRDVILELPQSVAAGRLEGLSMQVLDCGDNVEISTDDVDATIRELVGRDIPLNQLAIRPRTLEDLFLELTGKELRG
ncbi:MAG: ABC transporter ATP-binding protein [Gammaproteobacteria bacterium]|nr:ABC transporter ATP-binding protein [Gammaproteobacteria bacterium]